MNSFQPIDHPAAWEGTELFSQPDWEHVLTADEIAELDCAIKQVKALDAESFSASEFPLSRLSVRLQRIQNSLETGCGAVRIRGLDLSKYEESESRRMFWGMMCHLGTPVSQSATGEKIFSVRNEGHAEDDPRSRGPNTAKKLSFHTDRCDVISFLTLKQAKSGGENQLVSSISLYNEIGRTRPDLLEVLRQPYYYQRHNVDTGNEKPWTAQPIFSIYEGHFACNFLRVLIERAHRADDLPEMTPIQREALDYLEELASEFSRHVTFLQEPGEILLVNNWVLLHRRNAFEDYPDLAERRHLLRIWLSMPNSRPLHPDFVGNYGRTEAGAIRGGMNPATP